MKQLSAEKIQALFATASTEKNPYYTRALQALSSALFDLQKAGIDVSLTVLGAAAEQAFNIAPGEHISSWRQKSAGILRIGNSQHLVGFITQIKLKDDESEQWRHGMLLVVSKLDIRWQGSNTTIRPLVYDLGGDKNDLMGLQEFIIETAGAQCVIENADTHRSFAGPQTTGVPEPQTIATHAVTRKLDKKSRLS